MSKLDFLSHPRKQEESEEHWISISDLMTGLMTIFLFIAISYMITVQKDKKQIEQIAVTYQRLQSNLFADLEKEFGKDLERWNAILDKEKLSIRFQEPKSFSNVSTGPKVLFEQGSFDLQDGFKEILIDFFPRYITILRRDEYVNDISEIRIEGHTSSEWSGQVLETEAYINNMELSQNRTRAVLEYLFHIGTIKNNVQIKSWLKKRLTANGLSSSQLIMNRGKENKLESRRVEFSVRTDAESRIVQIIESKGEK